MIQVQQLSHDFSGRSVLEDLSFSVERGEVVGLLGPNGAGKTTCLRVLAGLIKPRRGRVLLGGLDLAARGRQARALLGYVAEGAPLRGDLRLGEYLRYRGRLRGLGGAGLRREVRRVSGLCGLCSEQRRITGQLSRGFAQRLALAAALLSDPPLLLLDEPTVGLDPNQLADVRRVIGDLAGTHTVLLSSHILSEVQASCGRVVVLHQGRLVAQGEPRRLVEDLRGRTLRVQLRCPAGELAALERLEGVSEVERLPDPDPTGDGDLAPLAHRLLLHGRVTPRLKEELVALVQREGWSLLELAEQEVGLEEVFARLTRGAAP